MGLKSWNESDNTFSKIPQSFHCNFTGFVVVVVVVVVFQGARPVFAVSTVDWVKSWNDSDDIFFGHSPVVYL